MLKFEDNDAGYIAWRDSHQHGFIVNCARTPKADYLVLHRAACPSITNLRSENESWTGHGYIKVCSDSVGDLMRWAKAEVDAAAELFMTCHCKP